MNPKRLLTKSLRKSPYGEEIIKILAAALDAVDPITAVNNHLARRDEELLISNKQYNLKDYERVFIVGFGKASIPMSQAAIEILGDHFTSGIAITKSFPPQFHNFHPNLSIIKASHPIPDESCQISANQIIELLTKTTERDLVIFLISGGGSALLTAPTPDVELGDIIELTKTLLDCGASIDEINTVRKHLSLVKGGGLARLAAPSQVVALILSDVVGDPLDMIASGPTIADPTTFDDALSILNKYQIISHLPETIIDHLTRGKNGEIPETPKAGDPIFRKTQNSIIGNNFQAAQAAIKQAGFYGLNTLLLTTSLEGEARHAGHFLASIARQIDATGDPVQRPACVVAGGETTVTITGGGKGGRNQELALSTVVKMAGLDGAFLITLATDGEDGPTDAGGAVVVGDSLSRAQLKGLDPIEFLSRNDSYHFFDLLGDNLKPGSTSTNVGDLTFIFEF
ncbi:glycerate kinase [bacterium SM23_57]|nr:MAG: glycerate kinase [bacterium SM23_57]